MSTNTTTSVSNFRSNSVVERTSVEAQTKLYESLEGLTFGEIMSLLKTTHPISSIVMIMNLRCTYLDTDNRDELINRERNCVKLIIDHYVSEEITYRQLGEVRDMIWEGTINSMKNCGFDKLVPYPKTDEKRTLITDKAVVYSV